jgi:hypothetical protein
MIRGFCHFRHRGVNAGRHGGKTTEYTSTDSPLLNVMYCVRVSLWTAKIFRVQHKREGGRGLSLYISDFCCVSLPWRRKMDKKSKAMERMGWWSSWNTGWRRLLLFNYVKMKQCYMSTCGVVFSAINSL